MPGPLTPERDMKTILITGCGSGHGLDTVGHFLANGWQVIATMRRPDADALPPSENLRIRALDVTFDESMSAAVAAAGPIDVLVNNAGIRRAAPIFTANGPP
jgi:NAD(P)-dependent dehydrogenase (short-subunit alcohol dehydrogenase family)